MAFDIFFTFEKLVHLFGFIIGIYHDARSSEYQIRRNICPCPRHGSILGGAFE